MLDERERLLAGDRLADTLRDMLDSHQQLLGCIEAKLQPTLVFAPTLDQGHRRRQLRV
jgi:hypothetical protein